MQVSGNPNGFYLKQVQPKHVKEAFRLLNKSIIRVETPDVQFDDDDEEQQEGATLYKRKPHKSKNNKQSLIVFDIDLASCKKLFSKLIKCHWRTAKVISVLKISLQSTHFASYSKYCTSDIYTLSDLLVGHILAWQCRNDISYLPTIFLYLDFFLKCVTYCLFVLCQKWMLMLMTTIKVPIPVAW